jgi:hypothetical protein
MPGTMAVSSHKLTRSRHKKRRPQGQAALRKQRQQRQQRQRRKRDDSGLASTYGAGVVMVTWQ